jgi:hypothetical protein
MDHAAASAGVAVCTMRTNFAGTGANVMTVVVPDPCPCAIGPDHEDPSVDT